MYCALHFFKTSVTLERSEIRQKSLNQIHRSLEDRTILFRAFLTYVSPFRSNGGAKVGARNTLLTDGTFTDVYHTSLENSYGISIGVANRKITRLR